MLIIPTERQVKQCIIDPHCTWDQPGIFDYNHYDIIMLLLSLLLLFIVTIIIGPRCTGDQPDHYD